MAHIDVFKGWAESIRPDVETFKMLLESTESDAGARRVAAGALLYLVSRMDLVADWHEGIGMIDDLMVLRVCAQLAQGIGYAQLPTVGDICMERMANEADRIVEFLGAPLYDKLKAYCAGLADQSVRGWSPREMLDDERMRRSVYGAISDDVKRAGPIVIDDPMDAELRLKSHLTQKLQ